MRLTTLAVLLAMAATLAAQGLPPPPPPPPPPGFVQGPARDPGSQPQTGTSAIAGVVVTDDATGRPIRHATVAVNGGSLRAGRQTVTDDRGRFLVADLPAGRFSLSVSKLAYVTTQYGTMESGRLVPTQITLAAGQQQSVNLKMTRGAVITGTIIDQSGSPQTGIRVQVMQYRMSGGQRSIGSITSGQIPTDDHGVYRVYGLAPGDYIVSATPQSGDVRPMTYEELQWARQQVLRSASGGAAMAGAAAATSPAPAPGPTVGYVPVYFPGTADQTSATTLTLAAGEERTGIDFSLQPVPTAKIEGLVVDPSGRPLQNFSVTLQPNLQSAQRGPLTNSKGAASNVEGKFAFSGVTPGRYVLSTQSTNQNAAQFLNASQPIPLVNVAGSLLGRGQPMPPQVMWAMTEIDVNGRDVSNVNLMLQPGLTISGRIAFEATQGQTPADVTRVRLSLTRSETTGFSQGVPAVGAVADGTFHFQGVTPGKFRLTGTAPAIPPTPASLPIPWTLKSVMADGKDILDFGLDVGSNSVSNVIVTFTDRPTDLSGTLFDAAGKPTRDYWVIFFSTDRGYWTSGSRRVRSIRPTVEGKYKLAGMPSGEYYLVAISNIDQVDLGNPTFLEQLAAASFKLTLGDGERKVQDLKLSGG